MTRLSGLCLICTSLAATGQAKPQIQTTSLPSGEVGANYSASLSASGGSRPYTWSISSGGLPNGLVLSSAGDITGAPTSTGNSSFTAKVTDDSGMTDTQSLQITIYPALSITISSLPPAVVGSVYSQTLSATGGSPPLQWSRASGSLPPGISLTPGGSLSGTPTSAGSFPF